MNKLADLIEKLEKGGQLPSMAAASQLLADTPANDEEEKPVPCPKCLDSGFYVPRIDDPFDPRFGRPVACDCAAVERNKRRRSSIMIEKLRYKAGAEARGLYRYHPDDLHQSDFSKRRSLTLNSLAGSRQWSKSQNVALELAAIFVETAPHCSIEHNGVTRKCIGFYGDKGYGKTLIASAIVNTLEERGLPVFGIRLVDLIKRVNSVYEKTRAADSNFDERPEFTSGEILDAFINFPILVIDEFEINNVTASRLDVVESLVNGRYAEALPTIITTNMDVSGIAKQWGERVADRIRDAYWFLKIEDNKLREASNEIVI